MRRISRVLLPVLAVLGLAAQVGTGPVDAAPAPVDGPQLVNVTAAKITGERRWDHTLTVSPGTWDPVPTSITYQWLRDGRPINGANQSTRKLTVADYGTVVSVKVRLHRDGFVDGITTPVAGTIDHRAPVRKVFTYRIATRGHIVTSTKVFADFAEETFANPRGWRSAGIAFKRVATGGSFTLVLADAGSMTSFGPPCDSTWSCRAGRYVVINQSRWLHASAAWNEAGLPLRLYRDMVVDHETGHWLGHPHKGCGGAGQLAPLMMQQSKGLHGCRFNPWPLPSERWTTR
jgi:hypothetical protein